MKILFWLCTFALVIAESYSLRGFINVYYKNYNGGPQSSSGSIKYYVIGIGIIIIAGLVLYFLGNVKVATIIVALPLIIAVGFIFFRMILPLLMGGRMN